MRIRIFVAYYSYYYYYHWRIIWKNKNNYLHFSERREKEVCVCGGGDEWRSSEKGNMQVFYIVLVNMHKNQAFFKARAFYLCCLETCLNNMLMKVFSSKMFTPEKNCKYVKEVLNSTHARARAVYVCVCARAHKTYI